MATFTGKENDEATQKNDCDVCHDFSKKCYCYCLNCHRYYSKCKSKCYDWDEDRRCRHLRNLGFPSLPITGNTIILTDRRLERNGKK